MTDRDSLTGLLNRRRFEEELERHLARGRRYGMTGALIVLDLNDFKIVLVNDRQDLEVQLGETATLIGGRVNVIGSTHELRQHLGTDTSDINMVMVHKFQEREQVLSNTVAEALGTYRAMPAGRPSAW